MTRYLLIRGLVSLLTFWVIVTLVFFMVRAAPGGPFDGERRLPPEVEANLLAAYNLDQPLPKQYVDYLGMLMSGDLGPSFKQQDFIHHTVGEAVGGGRGLQL
jgi:oligopeptide transport system permease protein